MGDFLGLSGAIGDVTYLIERSGPVGNGTLIVLLVFSILTWGIFAWKYTVYRAVKRRNRAFLTFFSKSRNLEEVKEGVAAYSFSPLARVFTEGYDSARHLEKEILREIKASATPPGDLFSRYGVLVGKNLDKVITIEIGFLEKYQTIMATMVSASPFLGLFGTVWGIMVAFKGVAVSGSASIAVVSSGLSEALITTVAGLAVAIPALFLYNVINAENRAMVGELDVFATEFSTILEKEFMKKVMAFSYGQER
jgi:biopolymer transport protein TolQ